MDKLILAIIGLFFAFMWTFILLDMKGDIKQLNEIHYPLCPWPEGCEEEDE